MPTTKEVLIFLEQIGLTDVILPFLLAFTIVYGVLQRSNVLGGKKNIDAMLAFVIGFFVVVTVRTLNVINMLSQYLALVLVASIMLAILMAFLGVHKKYQNALFWLIGVAVAFVILFVMGQMDMIDKNTLNAFFIPVLGIAAFVGLAWFILHPEKEKKPKTEKNAPEQPPGIEKETEIKAPPVQAT